jgi:hypothetical protein
LDINEKETNIYGIAKNSRINTFYFFDKKELFRCHQCQFHRHHLQL